MDGRGGGAGSGGRSSRPGSGYPGRGGRPGSSSSGGAGGGAVPPYPPHAPRPTRPTPPATPNLNNLVRPAVRLLVWGRSDMGQLGVGAGVGTGGRPQSAGLGGGGDASGCIWGPTPLEALAAKEVVGLAGGAFHTAFVTGDGELYTAGCNDSGQLGRRTPAGGGGNSGGGGGGSPSARPTHVTALESYNVVAAGCGANHTLVITEQGGVLAWGGNEFGQTGCGSEGGPDQPHPRPVRGLGDQRVVRLAVGANHALLLTGSGAVFAVGQGSFGALGLGEGQLESRPTPVPVLPLMALGVVQVAAGETHSAALTADGRVYTWGRGRHGQLGHGDWENRPRPLVVASLRGMRAQQVACGGDHTLVLAEAPGGEGEGEGAGAGAGAGPAPGAGTGRGAVFSFGRGTWGATGLGSTDNTCRPCRVRGLLGGEHVVLVSAGSRHSLALTASHAVFAFGNNDFGQLGLRPATASQGRSGAAAASGASGGGDVGFVTSPRRVTSLPPLPVVAVVAAGDASMALLQEARPGHPVPSGPRPGRRPGLHLTPYDPPDLRRLTAAAATASEDPRAAREVVTAVEDVLSSPGFVLATFEDRNAGGGGGGSDGSPGAPPHGMDVGAIQSCFEALLRLYNRDVIAALGNSLNRLLDSLLLQATTSASASGRPSSVAAARPVLGGIGSGAAGAAAMARGSGPSLRSFGSSGGPSAGGGGGDDAAAAAGRLSLLRLLFVVFQCPLLAGSGLGLGLGSSLASRLIAVAVRLPGDGLRLLSDWLVSLPPELLGGRVVRPLQHHITRLVEAGAAAAATAGGGVLGGKAGGFGLAGGGGGPGAEGRTELMAAARVMAGLYEANERVGCKLPLTEFHNPRLSAAANLRSEYLLWLEVAGGRTAASPASSPPPLSSSSSSPSSSPSSSSPPPLLSLCQVPFLLTPEAKSRILQGEAHIQKEAEMSASAREALLQGLHPISSLFLDISVRRGPCLLPDAAAQLTRRPPNHLKRPLRVTFVSAGDVAEEGVDQGGVSREFFQLLVSEIFQPQYGMFTYNEESRTFWFNPASASAWLDEAGVDEFRLVGAVMGLAIYNGVILDLHFPRAVYKKLLGEAVGLADLEEAFPTLGRSLRAVLAMNPEEVEGALCRNFEVEYDAFGERRTVPLVPGGSSLPVTGANVGHYVSRLVEWSLGEGVEAQFRAFAQGFHQVCGGPALSLFRHQELELLICGLPHLDFGALEANARYEGGYHKQHPTIVMFWQIIHTDLDLDARRRFLSFTTGCDRAPVAGLGALVLIIQRAGPDTERLPTAHTCFNALLLPEYDSRDKMRTKLLTAIENAQGFGLK